jgi:hypothetical protein
MALNRPGTRADLQDKIIGKATTLLIHRLEFRTVTAGVSSRVGEAVFHRYEIACTYEHLVGQNEDILDISHGRPAPPPMIQTELWLTPLILLPGVALLIMSTSARLWQIHEEFHRLLDHPDDHAKIIARQLVRRGALFRDALVCLYASVGLFSIASLLGGFINLLLPHLLWLVGGITLVGIAMLVFAAAQLIRESFICMNVITDSQSKLEGTRPDAS